MRIPGCIAIWISVLIWAAPSPAADEDPKPGKATTVTCVDDPAQTYDCYLPGKYQAARKWPILYCFSPSANGRAFVKHYKDVCEKHGWIVVASNNSKNGPWGPIKAAMDAMWKDTQARFSTHPTRCYSTGWSGGSGAAFDMAANHPKRFAGVIPIAVGSGWDRTLPRLPEHISVFFVIGDKDSMAFVKNQSATLKAKGHKTRVEVFKGGHVWPPKKVVEQGVDWLQNLAPRPNPAEQFDALLKLELKRKVARRLNSAVKYAGRGNFKAAFMAAERVLAAGNSTEAEKADAKFLKEAILERQKQMFDTAGKLLEENLPYEARLLFEKIRKYAGGEDANRARDRVKEIASDIELREALRAGKLFNQALDYEAKGKTKRARALFRQVMKKYPDTKYAKMAEDRS